MNLVDLDTTALHEAFDAVQSAAASRGVQATWSEIVGLVPESALVRAGAHHIMLRGNPDGFILERKVRDAMAQSAAPSVTAFSAAVAAPTPAPGGGSVAAYVAALGAALVQMVAGLTVGRKKYATVDVEMQHVRDDAKALAARLHALVDEDASAYGVVTEAYKLAKDAPERSALIDAALVGAARTPLETARACAKVADLALAVAQRGNQNALSDAGVAALLAEAACKGAAYNVAINVAGMENRAQGAALSADAQSLVERVSSVARTVESLVQRATA
jgi:glutamate formiminotransferase/formiminotetrahydrofolate cyclodeaminase